MTTFKLNVNGQVLSAAATPDTPLLWFLRDHLGLTGTKYGCGLGVCGACVVHQAGKAVRACQVLVSEVGAAPIVTIEGLSKTGSHPVQQAWLEEDVAQCGFCQPGMIMTAAALLREKPQPSEEDVEAALSDLVCRCGTYPRIRKAVHRASALLKGVKK